MLAFGLGVSLASSLTALILVRLWAPASPHWRLAFYGTTLSAFHLLEFWPTAKYNNISHLSVKSFFPTENLAAYLMAHAFAFVECLVWRVLYWTSTFQWFGGPPIAVVLGLVLVVGGQLVRTTAIVQLHSAGSLAAVLGSGSSNDKQKPLRGRRGRGRRGREAVLVATTTGVYGVMRHPASFGFFWWAIGTQMVLGNIFSLLAAVVVGWSAFAGQARLEEESLRRSLGKPYLDYKKRVGTMMPFIG